jgi:hypothetical protein
MKYDTLAREILHYLAKANWCDDDTGADDFGLSVWLFENLTDEHAERGVREWFNIYRTELAPQGDDLRKLVAEMEGAWVIVETSDGVMLYKKFDSDAEACATFGVYEDAYTTWNAWHDEPAVAP